MSILYAPLTKAALLSSPLQITLVTLSTLTTHVGSSSSMYQSTAFLISPSIGELEISGIEHGTFCLLAMCSALLLSYGPFSATITGGFYAPPGTTCRSIFLHVGGTVSNNWSNMFFSFQAFSFSFIHLS